MHKFMFGFCLFLSIGLAQVATPIAVLHVLAEESAIFSNLTDKPKFIPQLTVFVKANDSTVELIKLTLQGGNVDGAECQMSVKSLPVKEGWVHFSFFPYLANGATTLGTFKPVLTLYKPTGSVTINVVQ